MLIQDILLTGDSRYQGMHTVPASFKCKDKIRFLLQSKALQTLEGFVKASRIESGLLGACSGVRSILEENLELMTCEWPLASIVCL